LSPGTTRVDQRDTHRLIPAQFADGGASVLTRLTDDHSWVHEQVSAGILTEDEAKTHPLKNVVTRALGGGPSVSPDLREMRFA